MPISAILAVFNEEKRIESTLKSLQWCDEIIIIDKNSTDKTRDIASSYGAKIYVKDEIGGYDANEIELALNKCSHDWVLAFTASDVIHPFLAGEIKKRTDSDFEYDTIIVPYLTYILGIDSVRSPWHTEYKTCVFRKSSLVINSSGVHDAMDFSSAKQYKLLIPADYCVYHLTHSTADIMMERHMRYWQGEAGSFVDKDLKKPFRKVLQVFYTVLLRKKTFLIGWDGVMLMFAFLSYYMMSFVYKWEKKNSDRVLDVYAKIKNDLLVEWSKEIKRQKTS